MRAWLTSWLVLFSLSAHAETLEVPFHFTTDVAASALSDGRFWNLPTLETGSDGVPAWTVPVLILLPPDLASRPTVEVIWLDCESRAEPTGADTGPLLDLQSGEQVLGLGTGAGADFQLLPVQREGAAPLLPVLLRLDHQSFPGGPAERCRSGRLEVTFERSSQPAPVRGHYLPGRLLQAALNSQDRAAWFKPYKRARDGHDYLIVARQAFASSSTQLEPFMAWKKAQGFAPRLITFEEIAGEMNAESGELERPEILRGWLQQHYEEEGFEYVLIIGSPNADKPQAIPMKQCWPAKEWENPDYNLFDVPTDLYYADLTGNWNPDGDEYWCELEDYMELPDDPEGEPDGARFDGVDLVPEVLVGRIPHFGQLPHYADGILERTMLYQQAAPESWHNRVLLPSPQICFPDGNYIDGSQVSQYLIDHSLTKNAYRHTTLGEWDGNLVSEYLGDDRLDMFTMPDYYNQGYGTVFWCAHGNQEVAARNTWFYDANANGLPEQAECESDHFINVLFGEAANDNFPAIFFQASCLTADPAVDGNLTHTLLQRVSVANVASTRLTLGLGATENGWEPSPYSPGGFTLGVYFVHTLTAQMLSVAESFHAAQSTLGYGIQPWTFKIRLEFNVYGDPSTRLPGCDGDDDCDDGNMCNGVELCKEGQCRRGTPQLCQPDRVLNPCESYACDPTEGCVYSPAENHSDCNDFNPCTQGDYCYNGACVPGDKKFCPPATEVCWSGYCEPTSGGCMVGPVDDGSLCLSSGQQGTCEDGACVADAPLGRTPDATADDVTLDAGNTDVVEVGQENRKGTGCNHSPAGGASWPLLLLLLVLLRVRPLRP